MRSERLIERLFKYRATTLQYPVSRIALYTAQMGETDPAAKPLKGFGGARVMEIIDRYDTNTYRVVYTVQFSNVIYVLHAFQKKSKSGIATPQKDIELIRRRLAEAQRLNRQRSN
jgi:phage-related protein